MESRCCHRNYCQRNWGKHFLKKFPDNHSSDTPALNFLGGTSHDFKNSSNAVLVTRQVEPIFLPLISPFSSVASTSASLTPRIFATSAEPSNSGNAPPAAAAGITGGTPPAAGAVACG